MLLLQLFLAASLLVLGGGVDGDVERISKKKILSLGGNGMIGSETLGRLIKTGNEEYDIVLVSRGSWPFDSKDLIAPHVRNIICDREEGINNCPDLLEEIQSTEQYYAVLDFSGYNPEWVQDAVDALQGKARVYVYVSTDSVYEVTGMKGYKETGRRSLETDAVRPSDERVRARLNERDEYGDEKLGGEEVLIKQRGGANGNKGIPYVFLRYADVIGPRDGTERFLTYYSWIKFHMLKSMHPIAVPQNVVETSSVTYVKDAAQSIIAAMDESNRGAWDEAYNIACEEVFNVTSQIMTIGHLMGEHHIHPQKVKGFPLYVYPSITIGPVDITKAKERLNFRPTSLDVALLETVQWYNMMFVENMNDFHGDVIEILIQILEETTGYDSEEELEAAIDKLFDEISDMSKAMPEL